MYEEEVDVTEIYFIVKGEWAIAFNSYVKLKDSALDSPFVEDEFKGPEDMFNNGQLIA